MKITKRQLRRLIREQAGNFNPNTPHYWKEFADWLPGNWTFTSMHEQGTTGDEDGRTVNFEFRGMHTGGNVWIDQDWSDAQWDQPETTIGFISYDRNENIKNYCGRSYVDYGPNGPEQFAGWFGRTFYEMMSTRFENSPKNFL